MDEKTRLVLMRESLDRMETILTDCMLQSSREMLDELYAILMKFANSDGSPEMVLGRLALFGLQHIMMSIAERQNNILSDKDREILDKFMGRS